MRKTLLIITAFMAFPTFGEAQSFGELATIEVLPGWRTDAGEHIAGLRVTLEPGWKTYWRAPGDGGIPPQFSFQGSDNITGAAPHWPVPEVFRQNGLNSIGYHDTVVFPLTVFSDNPDAEMRISGDLHIGVCEEICIPVTLPFDAVLPATGERDTAITAALINRPLTQAEAGVSDVTCAISPISDGLAVTATMNVAATDPAEFVVIEAGDANVWVSEADTTRTGNSLSASVDMIHTSGNSFALDRSKVRITILGGTQAIDIQGCGAG